MPERLLFRISAIIATKDRYEDIVNCLNSLNSQTYLPYEIVIVDSSRSEKVKEVIDSMGNLRFKLTYIRSAAGLTLQRNVGVKLASGDLLAFFDDDIILSNDFFEQAIAVFSKDTKKRIGGIAGRITNDVMPRWSLQGIVGLFTFLSYSSYGQVRASGFNTDYNWCTEALNVDWLPGGLTIYRRSVFNEFSFDENMEGYCYNEDLDFSYRVSRKYECWYIPQATVLHKKSESRLSPKIARTMIVNNNYLMRKNILPGRSMGMKALHLFSFYIAICSFLIFLLVTGKLSIFSAGISGFFDVLFAKDEMTRKLKANSCI